MEVDSGWMEYGVSLVDGLTGVDEAFTLLENIDAERKLLPEERGNEKNDENALKGYTLTK